MNKLLKNNYIINMEQIINQLISNFDITIIAIVNILTYLIIKIIDEINKEKIVTTWQKRIVFIVVSIIISIIYYYISDVKLIIIINSIIVAPIAWSWLAKPIAKKLGIDYKTKIDI